MSSFLSFYVTQMTVGKPLNIFKYQKVLELQNSDSFKESFGAYMSVILN